MTWSSATLGSLVPLLVLALAVARVTRLVTTDRITVGFRVWVVARFGEESLVAYWTTCPWCVSILTGGLMTGVSALWPNNRVIMAVYIWWAVSYMVGLLSQLERE